MVSLPLHGEIYAVNGDDIVALDNICVISEIHMGKIYTCMGFVYLCKATYRNVFLFGATLEAC